MLTKIQLGQFQVFGCVVLRGVLTADEIETAGSEFDVGLGLTHESDRSRSGVRGQLNWTNERPEAPFLSSLMEDERFYGAAKQILGEDAVGFLARCNSFDGYRTEWHPDMGDLAWHGVKFGFYLERLDGETGALRLIPGSHKDPFFSDLHLVELRESYKGAESGSGLRVEDVPAFVAASEPGDVVMFDNHTWHASYGGGKGRRMCTLGYFAPPKTAEEEEATRNVAGQDARVLAQWPAVRPHPAWLENQDGSPVRKRWIGVLRQWGFAGN